MPVGNKRPPAPSARFCLPGLITSNYYLIVRYGRGRGRRTVADLTDCFVNSQSIHLAASPRSFFFWSPPEPGAPGTIISIGLPSPGLMQLKFIQLFLKWTKMAVPPAVDVHFQILPNTLSIMLRGGVFLALQIPQRVIFRRFKSYLERKLTQNFSGWFATSLHAFYSTEAVSTCTKYNVVTYNKFSLQVVSVNRGCTIDIYHWGGHLYFSCRYLQ